MLNEATPEQLDRLPRLYETQNVPLRDKQIHIHFFLGRCDWFISEYDGRDLFFGYAIINDIEMAEWGYVSFKELKALKIPPCMEVECEVFDPPLKASEIEEIRIN